MLTNRYNRNYQTRKCCINVIDRHNILLGMLLSILDYLREKLLVVFVCIIGCKVLLNCRRNTVCSIGQGIMV